MKVLVLMMFLMAAFADQPIHGAPILTYADLTHRLYDLKRLATPPTPGESTGSATSYDRASTYDAKTDRYINWAANNDGGGYVRREGDSIVAADLKGPGVIWRVWAGTAESGHIKIIIDGAAQPVLDVPTRSFFDAENGPFPFKQLVRTMASGYDCFVPIPYQKSCKVVLDKGWGNGYYQFTYSQFPAGTQVPSFSGKFDAEEMSSLAAADRAWAARGVHAVTGNEQVLKKTFTLAPGKSVDVARFDSPQAITEIVCSVDETEATAMERALREVSLSISWDGEALPSVWSPLGDFFGSGPGLNPFSALPCGMTGEGMYSSWYMPFDKAVVKLTNDGSVARRITMTVVHEPLDRPANSLLRFHAKWHRNHWGGSGPGRYAKDRWPDWPMLLASGGPGRFCGVALDVWNPLHVWNAELAGHYVRKVSELCPDPEWFKTNVMPDYWWGEGDEKFFVDGEKFPSTFGTGTEDYFGFSYGTPQVFDSATQCQTLNNANVGHISLARFHIADDVPFQNEFEAGIEKYHGDNWPLLYAVTVYWYQAPGIVDKYSALPIGQRENYYTLPELAPSQVQPPH